MKQSIQISTLIIFTLLVVFPLAAMSAVRVSLKNGRDIVADSCRETGNKLVCEKMGGSFEVEKQDILDVQGITIERGLSQQGTEEKPGQESESGQKVPVKPEADLKGTEKQQGGDLVKGLKPEEEKRLDEIEMKKKEYQTERQRLIDERQKLHEDVKKMGMITNQEQYNALKRRISELETRINNFNEDVRKLNEEQQKIVEGSRNRQ